MPITTAPSKSIAIFIGTTANIALYRMGALATYATPRRAFKTKLTHVILIFVSMEACSGMGALILAAAKSAFLTLLII